MKGGESMSITILPTFKGYTVDMRLREFRKAIPGVTLEFIPFDSPEGEVMLEELKAFAREVLSRSVYQEQPDRKGLAKHQPFFCARFIATLPSLHHSAKSLLSSATCTLAPILGSTVLTLHFMTV